MRRYSAFVWVLVVVLLVAIAYSAVYASPEITAGLVVAAATALVSVLSVVVSKQREQEMEIQQEQRKKKAEVYEQFMSLWIGHLTAQKMGQPPKQKELHKAFGELTQQMIVWGSEPVVLKYSGFREHAGYPNEQRSGAESLSLLLEFEEVLFGMRADLGYSNKGLSEGDLLALFVNDIREKVRKSRTQELETEPLKQEREDKDLSQ